jgi:hypothetical protein
VSTARRVHSDHRIPSRTEGAHRSSAAVRLALIFAALIAAIRPASGAATQDLLLQAQEQFAASHFDQALKLYKEADQQEPGDSAVEYNMGLCHMNLGDGDNAVTLFEGVASRADISDALRADAWYNLGLVRATAARQQFEQLRAPTTQPAEQRPIDSPENIETLQAIADELLQSIMAFRAARDISPDSDAKHNMTAARVTRRDVLGLLKRATEAKEKEDILEDPQAYLDALILEQNRQVGLIRHLQFDLPDEPRLVRQARRAAVRVQRKLMERTDTFVDHLGQFRETQEDPSAPPSTQPAEPTPREQLYKLVAKTASPAVQNMRDACAYFLDGDIPAAYRQQRDAREALRAASALFPMEPAKVLVQWRVELEELKQFVSRIESDGGWLGDPGMPEVVAPDGIEWDAEDTAIHDMQKQIGDGLARLLMQCEHIATTSRPAEPAQPQQENPALDPELNAKLAEVLEQTEEPQTACLSAIITRHKQSTIANQEELAKIIDEALQLLPKSLVQKLAALVQRQAQLNEDVQALAGTIGEGTSKVASALLGKVKQLAADLKSRILGAKPTETAAAKRDVQKNIHTDTLAVAEEIKTQIPSGGQPQGGSASPDQAQVQALIEASKHLEPADFEMLTAIEGLDKAVIEDSLRPLREDGPVQAAQAEALEALIKALMALQPPDQQQQQNEQDEQQNQEQDQQQQDRQDVQRAVEQVDKQREQAQRELYKKKPQTVIKDW